ncbi:MAG: RHO alpha subunit C-terminal catalytic domain-containing protein [Planctomycetia bacterium]
MFVSDTHLPQLLPPAAYYDHTWHARELDRVLRPAWWAVAHNHVHPSFMWVDTDLGVGYQSIVPTGPTSCRISFRVLTWQSRRSRPLADACVRAVSRLSLWVWQRIIAEDLAMLPLVQAGIESPRHPGPGLISRREERITHFQRWLLERVESDDPRHMNAVPSHTEHRQESVT